MSEFSKEVLSAAQRRIGSPFAHHFMPENTCEGGLITLDECMEKGLNNTGYDCSGLVIASLCEVLAIDVQKWPKYLRHARQLEALALDVAPASGDVILFYTEPKPHKPSRPHIGLLATEATTVHANGRSGFVDEGQVQGDFIKTLTIPSTEFISLGK